MDQNRILITISGACLRHHDSGETSNNREARIIISALEDAGFKIIQNRMSYEKFDLIISKIRCAYDMEQSASNIGIKLNKLTDPLFNTVSLILGLIYNETEMTYISRFCYVNDFGRAKNLVLIGKEKLKTTKDLWEYLENK